MRLDFCAVERVGKIAMRVLPDRGFGIRLFLIVRRIGNKLTRTKESQSGQRALAQKQKSEKQPHAQ
ncbi:hypothetical protein [Bradyrhizobium sp. LTSP857]|uniref:hypothetical protein n=1 Tax=Bradyrhizobium sp. LTSP857 TaxID=1619231 RepID=UPI0012DFEBCF|nr:hypothetical protein [Bradyrhizobium sp. LTSP857]